MLVGILAAQGAYKKHKEILDLIEINSIFVKDSEDLSCCDALIIPGGESTAIYNFINSNEMFDSIKKFSTSSHVFGTCAGMILMSCNKPTDLLKPLELIDFKVDRNAYGSQLDSFIVSIDVSFDSNQFTGVFIRAPKVTEYSNDIDVLAYYKDYPVLIRKDKFLACSFHPELTNDFRIHKYFIDMVNNAN